MGEWNADRLADLRERASGALAAREAANSCEPENAGFSEERERLLRLQLGALEEMQGALTPDAVLSLLDAIPQWFAVTPETMPASGRPVLAFYRNSHGNGRIVRAQWAARWTLRLDADAADYESELDEEENEWCPEGWYEDNENEDVHWRISEAVTHYMPLPAPPA